MIVRGELQDSHIYRLHQVVESAVIILRLASVTNSGLFRLMDAARLMRRHQFVFVLRRSKMRDKQVAPVLNRVRRYKNVLFGVIEDERDSSNIQRRRVVLYATLVRSARRSVSEMAV